MRLRILGAGGHAKVAIEAWRSAGGTIEALHDDCAEKRGTEILGVRVSGAVAEALAGKGSLHVAIGENCARAAIAEQAPDARFPPLIHAAAIVSGSAAVGAGALICAGAVAQAEARIGRHVIVNSLALVEHDVVICDFAHVAPGVRLGGSVRIGARALVGIGAVVLPGIVIGEGAVVGGGALVTRDVPAGATVVGNPARALQRNP